MHGIVRVRRALISVSDKRDLIPFAKSLASFGVEIVSTGGTASALAAAEDQWLALSSEYEGAMAESWLIDWILIYQHRIDITK